jgi:hypothetical protein
VAKNEWKDSPKIIMHEKIAEFEQLNSMTSSQRHPISHEVDANAEVLPTASLWALHKPGPVHLSHTLCRVLGLQ